MTTFLGSYTRPRRRVLGEATRIGKLVGLSADSMSATVELAGETFELPVAPGKYVPDAYVSVLESKGKPRRVTGPAGVWPEGLDADAEPPAPVTAVRDLGPREFTPAEQAKLDSAVADLGVAQSDLDNARTLLEALGTATTDDEITAALAAYMGVDPSEVSFNAALYDAVLTKLLVATEIVTDTMLAKKSVTAPALNVVYSDPVTGYGFSLQPEGLTILDADGQPAISLRTDMANYFNIIQGGESVASISPDGGIVGQSVSANQSMLYRGVEMDTRLEGHARGLIRRTRLTTSLLSDGAWCLLAEIKFVPVPGRAYSATIQYTAQSSTLDDIGGQVAAQFAGDGMTFRQSWSIPRWNVTPARPVAGTVTFDFDAADANLDTDGNATLKIFGRSVVPGRQVRFYGYGTSSIDGTTGCGATLHDVGPSVPVDLQTGNEPPLIGSGGTTPPPSGGGSSPVTRTGTWNSTGHRTYSYTGLTSTRAGSWLVQGYMGGANSRGHWIFPSVTTALNGAANLSGTLTIHNGGTGTGSVNAVLRVHNYASAPSTFGTSQPWTTVSFTSGQTRTITLPSWILTGLRDGTIKGFSLDHGGSTSSSFYGYFSPTATLKVNYTK